MNVDSAKKVGEDILHSMEEKCVDDFVFKKIDQAVTLNTKAYVKIDQVIILVDPQLLFKCSQEETQHQKILQLFSHLS